MTKSYENALKAGLGRFFVKILGEVVLCGDIRQLHAFVVNELKLEVLSGFLSVKLVCGRQFCGVVRALTLQQLMNSTSTLT